MGIIQPPKHSDGDITTHPASSDYTITNVPTWLRRLGVDLSEARGQNDHTAELKRLPTGYAIFRKKRQNGKYISFLYGHPSGKKYPSTADFSPHLQWLDANDGTKCNCVLCKKTRYGYPRNLSQSSSDTDVKPSASMEDLDLDDDQSSNDEALEDIEEAAASESTHIRQTNPIVVIESKAGDIGKESSSPKLSSTLMTAKVWINTVHGCEVITCQGAYNIFFTFNALRETGRWETEPGPKVMAGWITINDTDHEVLTDVININVQFETLGQPITLVIASISGVDTQELSDVEHINVASKSAGLANAPSGITVSIKQHKSVSHQNYVGVRNINLS